MDNKLNSEITPVAELAPLKGSNAATSLSALKSVDDWADRINAASAAGVASAIEEGQLLHAARIALKHGGWSELFRGGRLTLGKRTAEKRMEIAETCGSFAQAPAHLEKLPCDLEALYYVARLGPGLLLELMSEGTVHSGLKEGKAQALLYEHRPELKCPPRPFDMERVLSNIRQQARAIIAHATPEQLQSLPAEFQEIAAEVGAAAAARIQSGEKRDRHGSDLQVPAWIMDEIADEDDLTGAIKPLNRLKKLNALNPAPAQTTK